MKVLYDISWLGYAHATISMRTGLFRAIETTALNLASSPECSLTLCGGDSFEAVRGCQEYLKNQPELVEVPFAYSHLNAYLETAEDGLNRRINETGKGNFSLRAARKAVRSGRKLLLPDRGPLDRRSLNRGDIYHSPFLAIPGAVRQSPRLKIFLTIYDLIPKLFPELCSDAAPAMLDAILQSIQPDDWILCISETTKNDLCNQFRHLDPDKVLVVYLGASGEFFPCQDPLTIAGVRKKFGIPDAPYILSLSSLDPRKRLDHLIHCFARMVKEQQISDLNLVLAGPKGWKYERIFEMLEDHSDIKERIILTGFVDDNDLSALYSGALAFAFPSLYEGFGLPVLEAMQCGVPVITSNTSSLPEIVGDSGIMVDPMDSDALCEAMLNVYEDADLRERLSKQALERSTHFSWSKSVDETVRAYTTALES